jgi:hypothetical protein
MRVAQMLRANLIDPVINRLADRVSDRVASLLEQHAFSAGGGKRILDAQVGTPELNRPENDLVTQRRDEIDSTYAKVIGEFMPPVSPPVALRRRSELCKQADFSLDAYRYWSSALRLQLTLHRKHWEFFYICQALYERGLLAMGRTGLAFGVGREPLPALFASLGCAIVATDQISDDAKREGWQITGQHADSVAALEKPEICDPSTFRKLVSFETLDMNNIPAHLAGRFDFCWSACCLEHLGSLEHGLRFIESSLNTLKIGGVAVHTTEFNLSSDTETLESRDLSIYRKGDIEGLITRLKQVGHQIEPLDLNKGTTFVDGYIDLPPYRNEPHLRLRIDEYDCTSIGLIVTRGQENSQVDGS